jgi:hypothetical protein
MAVGGRFMQEMEERLEGGSFAIDLVKRVPR